MKKLGFGTMRLPQLETSNPKSIDLKQVEKMVDSFLDQGFIYFDTAYPYHEETSEIAVKKCLVDRYPRDRFILADKMPIMLVKNADDYERFFTEQLQKTGVDYFDYYLLHNLGVERYPNTQKFGGFEFIAEKKKQGLIKNAGISFHDRADFLDQVLTDHPELDFVQLQINYMDWESVVIQSRLCYEVCEKHGKPVIVMEPVKGGVLANLPERALKLIDDFVNENKELYGDTKPSPASFAIRYAASLDNVFMVLSGMSQMDQMLDNTAYMQDFKPLCDKEYKLIEEITRILLETIAIPCTNCRYCMEVCPKNVHIPAYFGLFNMHATTGNKSNMYYQRAYTDHALASECIQCGKCEKNCPQHIDIRKWLKEFVDLYEVQ